MSIGKKSGKTPNGKDPLDPWSEIAGDYPEHTHDGPVHGAVSSSDRVGLFEGIQRFFVLLFWRPVSTLVYLLGLTYGCVCIYLFANGHMMAPYGFTEAVIEGGDAAKAMIAHDTPVVSQEGVGLLLIWLIVPPLWFFIESYVLCKTPQQRAVVKEAQDISVKVWLALLGVMAILAK